MENRTEKKARYYIIAYYKPDENKEKKIKILDQKFIKRNKNKCKIIYKNKIYELKEYFEGIDMNYNHKDLIKFKIIFIHNIFDMSYMFYKCDSLVAFYDNYVANLNCTNFQMYIINRMACLKDVIH